MARVRLQSAETASGDVAEALARLREHGTVIHPLLLAVANSTGTFRNFLRLPNSLIGYTRLPGRLREICVLRLAHRTGSAYEWVLHEPYALKAGLTREEMAAIRDERLAATVLTPADRTIMKFTDEVLGDAVSDETFEALQAVIGTEEIVDLAVAIGWWGGMVPLVSRALGISADDLDGPD